MQKIKIETRQTFFGFHWNPIHSFYIRSNEYFCFLEQKSQPLSGQYDLFSLATDVEVANIWFQYNLFYFIVFI